MSSAPEPRLPNLSYSSSKTTCGVASSGGGPAPVNATMIPREVLIAQGFKGGGYKWTAAGTGSAFDLRFKGKDDAFGYYKGKDGKKHKVVPKLWTYDEKTGEWVWPKDPSGTYCTGFTLGVAWKVAQERGLLEGKSMKELSQFQQQWNGGTEESKEKQLVSAMENAGIGKEVKDLKDARPGDFVQIWRSEKTLEYPPGSGTFVTPGHSVVFLNWITDPKDPARIIGIHYRASNQSNGKGKESGVDERTEYFKGNAPKGTSNTVDPARVYVGRLNDKA